MNFSDLQKKQNSKQETAKTAPATGPAKADNPNAPSNALTESKEGMNGAGHATSAQEVHQPKNKNGGHATSVSNTEDPVDDPVVDAVYETFDDMDLKDELLRGIFAIGFVKPSYIQMRGILPVIKGRDTIAQAQSGYGKTATFCIGALEKIIPGCGSQVLIMAPTRELANQIHGVCSDLAQYMKGAVIHACVGGTHVRADIDTLRRGVDVVVGTPGRCFDMIQRNELKLNRLKTLVLDEADEMLERGFQDQVYEIFSYMPNDVQVCLFSATMPDRILELTTKFMRNPKKILVAKKDVTLSGIKQFYVDCDHEQWKFGVLCDLYENLDIAAAIIFVNSKARANWLGERLNQEDFTVSVIHGGLDNQERKRVMREFRSGSSRILIASDLLARGIDVANVSLVINYDIPKPHQKESYIHRIGRSGRYGKKGCAINFVTKDDVVALRTIEQFYSTQIDELPEDIAEILG